MALKKWASDWIWAWMREEAYSCATWGPYTLYQEKA